MAAAYKIADAENKSFVAAEAVKELERLSEMAEEAESTLQVAAEILEKCNTQTSQLLCLIFCIAFPLHFNYMLTCLLI